MPQVVFGTHDGPRLELEESPDLIAVRTRSRVSVRGVGPVAAPAAREVADGELVVSFDDAGVEVFRVPVAEKPLDERKMALRAAPDVRFAGSVLVHPGTREPVLYTENAYVRFVAELEEEACEALIREAGFVIKEKLGFAPKAFFVCAPEGTGQAVFEMALWLVAKDEVVHCHPELIQRRATRQIAPEQWHLAPSLVGGVQVTSAHAHVEAAHAVTRGAGTTIAVIDDGVDVDHLEFNAVGKVVAPLGATSGTTNPRPVTPGDNHGTACAGVACADGVKASGVAPDARLMPIRLRSGLGSISESKAFKHAADHGADVISCSWGPADGEWFNPNDPVHQVNQPLLASSKDAIDYAVTHGRGGKGCVICWAAGNGNESVENDGYARYEKVIAVAACNDRSKRSVYSDFGESIWCSFPSNDFGFGPFSHPAPLTPGIWTTDRSGAAGYNDGDPQRGSADGDYTNSFGGTSSACPGAAGVASLVLSSNPDLRWDEVKDVLRRSCDRIDPQGGGYDGDGHSDLYGYGRLNAETAVRLASDETPRQLVIRKVLNVPIPDLGEVGAQLEVAEGDAASSVGVYVKLRHTYVGDLVLTAVPPAGSGLPEVVLQSREGGWRDDLDRLYGVSNTPGLAAYSGQVCTGTWTVRIEDRAARDAGTLVEVALHLEMAS